MSRAKKRAVFIAAIALFIAAAVTLGFFDRLISESYFKTASSYGGFFEVVGEPPAILLSLYCFNLLAATDLRRGRKLFWIVFSACVWAYLLIKLGPSFGLDPFPILPAAAAGAVSEAVCVAGFGLWMRKKHAGHLSGGADPALESLRSRCAKAAIACVFTLISVSSLKTLWGRVRPRDVYAGGKFGFFWEPHFFSGNRSFPSGHTANAATLGALVFFTDGKRARVILWLILAVWIGAVALSRVRGGAHFPTDVLFGAAFGLLGVALGARLKRAERIIRN